MKSQDIYINKLQTSVKFLIGQNAKNNFEIIDNSQYNDLWFHISNVASCHVIACIHDLEINKKDLKYIITQGALLCKQNSKYKSEKNIEIIYTEIKNIQKTDTLGKVITKNTKIKVI